MARHESLARCGKSSVGKVCKIGKREGRVPKRAALSLPLYCLSVPLGLHRPASRQQVNHEDHEGEDEQQMYKAADRDAAHKTQKPQHE